MNEELVNTIDSRQMATPNGYLLFHELSHRIKNEFASAIGFISVEESRSSNHEVKAALSAVANLLHNYAGVHNALQMPSYNATIEASDYLRTLCQSISRADWMTGKLNWC